MASPPAPSALSLARLRWRVGSAPPARCSRRRASSYRGGSGALNTSAHQRMGTTEPPPTRGSGGFAAWPRQSGWPLDRVRAEFVSIRADRADPQASIGRSPGTASSRRESRPRHQFISRVLLASGRGADAARSLQGSYVFNVARVNVRRSRCGAGEAVPRARDAGAAATCRRSARGTLRYARLRPSTLVDRWRRAARSAGGRCRDRRGRSSHARGRSR